MLASNYTMEEFLQIPSDNKSGIIPCDLSIKGGNSKANGSTSNNKGYHNTTPMNGVTWVEIIQEMLHNNNGKYIYQ